MKSRMACAFLLLGLAALAGCGGNVQVPPAPSPTVTLPKTTPTPAGPPPLSLYFSALTPITSLASTPPTTSPSTVSALDASTGQLRWKYTAEAQVQSVPVVDQNTLYVGASDQKVYALNVGDGSVRWKTDMDGQPYVIALQDGVLYGDIEQSTNGHVTPGPVFALNASNGALKWLSSNNGSFYGLVDNTVYATAGSQLYALDPADGSVRWQFQMGAQFGGLKVAQGQVYLLAAPRASGTPNVILYVLNASTGAQQWRYPSSPKDLENVSLIGAENGAVYLVSSQQQNLSSLPLVLALNASDGSVLWQYTASDPTTSFTATALDNSNLYLGTDGGVLLALSLQEGSVLWQTSVTQSSMNIDLMDNGVIYITVSGEGVAALETTTGSVLWRYQSSDYVGISSARDTSLYGFSVSGSFGPNSHNYILALRASNGSLLWRYDAGASSVYPVLN
jgi:outer membrane protein assembly factor BamB